MKREVSKRPKRLLRLYFVGSFALLFISLMALSIFFSRSFIKKEERRSDIFRAQVSSFFEFQYRTLAEEMWTQSYESIRLHIADISKELGGANYDMMLADEKGLCVFSATTAGSMTSCQLPEEFSDQMKSVTLSSDLRPHLAFDSGKERYIYMTPLWVGPILKGHLYVSLSDPYHFFRGHYLKLAMEMMWAPALFVLILWLFWLLAARRWILKPYFRNLVALEKREALGRLAAQVAHDIRSPLTTLSGVVESAKNLPPEERQILKVAAARIMNLADDLLNRYRESSKSEESNQFTLISSVIRSVIAEKTISLKSDLAEILSETPENALFFGSRISESDLARVLSNLINNSLEAINGLERGKVILRVSESRNNDGSRMVKIVIEDDGRGMDPLTLEKVRSIGGSYGKRSGAGMGLSHAKEVLKRVNGFLRIESKENRGTTVTLELPLAPTPVWLAATMKIEPAQRCVVLDDDESIHLLWRKRLQNDNVDYLKDPSELNIEKYPVSESHYIFDYEFQGHSVTGLDLIEQHGLGRRATLVTSHFNDPQIQTLAERLGAKILPKFMISEISFMSETIDDQAGDSKGKLQRQPYDLVLIDDEESVGLYWKYRAKQKKKNILVCRSENEFRQHSLSTDIPIYLDQNLSDNVKGVDVAKRLFDQGFRNIYLATADAISMKGLNFLKGVVSKEFSSL